MVLIDVLNATYRCTLILLIDVVNVIYRYTSVLLIDVLNITYRYASVLLICTSTFYRYTLMLPFDMNKCYLSMYLDVPFDIFNFSNRYSFFNLPLQVYLFTVCSALPLEWLKRHLREPWEGWVQQQVMWNGRRTDRPQSRDTTFPLSYEHDCKLVSHQAGYGLAD